MEIFGSKYNYNGSLGGNANEDMKEEENQEKVINKMLENANFSFSDEDWSFRPQNLLKSER